MLSKDTRLKIKAMSEDQAVGQEIISRISLLQKRPRFAYQVEDIIKSLDVSEEMNQRIEGVFRSKMSNYDHGCCGDDIASALKEVPALLKNALEYKPGKKTRDTVDKVEFEALALALSGIGAAKDFEAAYDNMLSSLTDLAVIYRERPEKEEAGKQLPIEIVVDARQDRIHEERTVLKRIRLKKK